MNNRRWIILLGALVVSATVIALMGLNATTSGRADPGEPILKYPSFPPTPTIGAAPTTPASIAGAPLLQQGFANESAMQNIQVVDPDDIMPEDQALWAVEDGALVQNRTANANSPNVHETTAMLGNPAWDNYTVSAKVYDENNITFGLVARRQGGSFYRYRVLANDYSDTPKQVLEKVIDGVATPLATKDSPGYDQRQWHTVSLSVVGSKITAILDGKAILEATDTALAKGQAGLYTRAVGGIRFDDVAITRP